MHRQNHLLPAFCDWLPSLFLLLSAIIISVNNALPQAQSDVSNVPLNNRHHGRRPTGNLLGPDGGGPPKEEAPYYPIHFLNDDELLLTPGLPPLGGGGGGGDGVVVVVENNNHNCRSSSSSSDDNSQSSLFRKRDVLLCPPPKPPNNSSPDPTPAESTPESTSTDPTPESTTPDPTPDMIAPHLTTLQESDDDKCPPNLMGMSRIPVCDSGRPGEDTMRLAGFDYYTLFKITPDEGSGCAAPSWPWCCASIGKQRHPLWLDGDDVTTGYICKDKDKEEWYAKYPDPEDQSFDGGKDLELGW